MKVVFIWIVMNLILPIVPFFLKAFIYFYLLHKAFNLILLINIQDQLIYSYILCIIILNINFNGQKNWFEHVLRILLIIIIILDNVILTSIYLDYPVQDINSWLIVALGFPIIVGPLYKFAYQRSEIE